MLCNENFGFEVLLRLFQRILIYMYAWHSSQRSVPGENTHAF